jgi:hypothetical protein
MNAFVATLLLAATAAAAPVSAQTASPSPLLGNWALDVTRLEIPADHRPKGVTVTYKDAGGGKWDAHVEILAPDGSKRSSTGTYIFDGTPIPVTGEIYADIAVVKRPEPNVMVLQLAKGKEPVSTRVYSVSADGSTMTETTAYFTKEGKPVLRTGYFKRVN